MATGVTWRVRGVSLVVVAMIVVAALPELASAHILFGDDDPNDIIADMAINFLTPLVVLGLGAVVGMVLARWLGRSPASVGQDDQSGVDEPPAVVGATAAGGEVQGAAGRANDR